MITLNYILWPSHPRVISIITLKKNSHVGHIYTYMYMYVYVHMYICIYMYVHICICMCVCMHVCIWRLFRAPKVPLHSWAEKDARAIQAIQHTFSLGSLKWDESLCILLVYSRGKNFNTTQAQLLSQGHAVGSLPTLLGQK